SITGWQILALRAARDLGCDIPARRIDLALEFVRRCHDPKTGGFGYQSSAGVTASCTGTGILALELRGADRREPGAARPAPPPEVLKAKAYLVNHPPAWTEPHFFYTAYYGAQAMYQPRSNYWHVYRQRLHQVLLEHQQRDGGWSGPDGYGPAYATALGVKELTVEYRLLPIYQLHDAADSSPLLLGRHRSVLTLVQPPRSTLLPSATQFRCSRWLK